MYDMEEVGIIIGYIGVVFLSVAAIAAILTALIYPLNAAACHARWDGSGHATDYGFFSGCRVQLEDGAWVPESRLINMNT